jgi:antitoxin component of MazEF toxin-antitoxin module
MKAVLSRWGDSTAVRLPKALLETLGMSEGDAVRVAVVGDGLKLTPDRGRGEAFFAALRRAKEAELEAEPLWTDAPRGSEAL